MRRRDQEAIQAPHGPCRERRERPGILPAWGTRDLPPLKSLLRALRPGVVWMALAQGSGELVWWPYIIAKYGLGFLFLLIPACLLQLPVNFEIGNLFTTLLCCLLAYALLFPEGLLPTASHPVQAQAEFFRSAWGALGAAMFLILATAFLSDTWITTIDAVSRVHADVVAAYVPGARRISTNTWYWIFVLVAGGITAVTVPLAAPGKLILFTSVVEFAGTVTFTICLLVWNHVILPRRVPAGFRPRRWTWIGIATAAVVYTGLAAAYVHVQFLR